jgi:hypothetical protein
MNEKEAKDLWVKFACAAIAGYEVPADFDGDEEELANDVADVAEAVADVMLETVEQKFPESGQRGGRRSKRPKRGRERESED